MDAHQIDAWAQASFDDSVADELVGFTPIIVKARETGSARVARERREAALRQRRSRANRAKAAEEARAATELDTVIADALRAVIRKSGASDLLRTAEGLRSARVSLHNLLGEAMNALVLDYAHSRDEAAKAVNQRLMR